MTENTDPSPKEVFLDVRDLACIRGDRALFEKLNFRVASHQILLVEGRNGSGKTTLLRILCGIRRQESGDVLWCGESIEELGPLYHQQMVYVGHQDGIKWDLTVLENLRLTRALGKPNGASIEEVLQQINLSGFEDVQAHALSAGQRRRLALARLLVTDNCLWILDEPFTALDMEGIKVFERLLGSHIRGGGMVILTSHHDVNFDGSEVQRVRIT